MTDKPMLGKVTLAIKRVETAPLKIEVNIKTNQGQIKGHITAHAIIRSKDEMEKFSEKFADLDTDIDLLRLMYKGIDGLGDESGAIEGDTVWTFLRENWIGTYLVPQLARSYYEQYAKAKQGN